VTLNWPPSPPEDLAAEEYGYWPPPDRPAAAAPADEPPASAGPLPAPVLPRLAGSLRAEETGPAWSPAGARPAGPELPDLPPLQARHGLTDPRLINGIAEITAMIAAQLDGAIDELAQAVHDQRYGLGPVTDYLRDPQVENVDINGCDRVWITYATGERVAGPPVAASDDALITMIRTWATRGGQTARDFSAASPLVNVALTGSGRMTATMSVTPRPCVSLRRHGQIDVSLPRLTELGTVDATVASFLAAAVRCRCNIIVTGGVNAGKTTLLRALASEIPPGERVATLESEYELYLHELAGHPDVIAFEAREANSEGAGGVGLHDLIAHALRHNPRRILVGEVRRSEIMPMLEAMNSGQEGSMCTLHANSPA
jgi:Flp pilus assembly CpaF family ATPase